MISKFGPKLLNSRSAGHEPHVGDAHELREPLRSITMLFNIAVNVADAMASFVVVRIGPNQQCGSI